jgi:hypothetical protein
MSYGTQQPYASPTPGSFDVPPKKPGWSMGCILGVIAAVVGVVALLCCGGLGGSTFFFYQLGMDMISKTIKEHPVVREKVGEVSSCTPNFEETGKIGKQNHIVFDVKGSKSNAVVTVHTQPAGQQVRIVSGTVKLPTGETTQLVPDNPLIVP